MPCLFEIGIVVLKKMKKAAVVGQSVKEFVSHAEG